MGEPSKHAKEAVERIAQRLRWGFFGPADREAMSEIIDRAIHEATEPLENAAISVKVSLKIVETSKDNYLVAISEAAADQLLRAIGAMQR